MAQQRVKLSAAQARAVVALAKERSELQMQLGEVRAALDELGELYRQKHQLPPGETNFWGERNGDIYLVVEVKEEELADEAVSE